MATYPAYPHLIGSGEQWLDDVSIDRSVSGAAKARAFYTVRKRRFTLKHKLAASDLTDLKTFYDANRTLAVSFAWPKDAATYSCYFESPPQVEYLGGALAEVVVRLVEV